MDRRTFSKLSALTLAGSNLPSLSAFAQGSTPLRFAPVGLGSISEIFMRACENSPKAKITGLVTGHPDEKGPKYASQYNVPKDSIYTYETFDRIRDNKNIDAVYIGLPNSMHAEYTIRAARAGKHVLCEKPMAISSAECRSMIDACKKANVKLMIAYRVHYDPTYQQMIDMVRSGAIGQLKNCEGSFQGIGHGWRIDRKLAGGGSLMDLGIYPLNGIRYMLGEEPSDFAAMVATRSEHVDLQGIEETLQWVMRFPSGVLATCSTSYGAGAPDYLKIIGNKGFLLMQPAYGYQGVHLTGRTANGPVDIPSTGKAPFQFTLEAEHFADCVHNNTAPKTAGEEGLADLIAMEAIYKAAGTPIA